MMDHPMALLLVVEDSDEDFKTLLRIFGKLSLVHPVQRCANARDCLDYLHATGKYAGRRATDLPALLLLDLNLPGADGHMLLRRLKAEPALKRLPVVIITTSSNPTDVQTCYEEGASSYLIKPVDYATFEQTIRRFIDYWLYAVRLPFPEDAVL